MRSYSSAILVAIALLALAVAHPAGAHPMGNFSINHYARLEARADRVAITYLLDFAEIPTIDERSIMDTNRDDKISDAERKEYLRKRAVAMRDGLRVTINGRIMPLAVRPVRAEFKAGAGSLDTLRLTLALSAPLPNRRAGATYKVEYRDVNFHERAGWKEIIAVAGAGAILTRASVSSTDKSHALTEYRVDPDIVPPQQTEASFTMMIGMIGTTTAAALVPSSPGHTAETANTPRSLFTQSIAHHDLTPGLMVVGLLLALMFGALHALQPGHGKTLVAAYLVGSRGTPRHAVTLGVIVTLTHTFGVFLLGFVTLFASHYIVPEQLYPWLSAASGIAICGVGVWLLFSHLRGFTGGETAHEHDHEHHHDHDHEHTFAHATAEAHHDHAHEHPHRHQHGHHHDGADGHSHDVPEGPITGRTLVALGISGGIVPCPEALVVLLAAIKLNRVGYGMLLITAFSVGLAAALIAIGLLIVLARNRLDSVPSSGALQRLLPIGSAAVITLIGIVLTANALALSTP